mmetsp:Transcript_35922/g.110669  ORF Transcript_35922/g.110669 Transcript_35922/m.110669 type:complete len:218 (-) Transcript_35922:291-944(-)
MQLRPCEDPLQHAGATAGSSRVRCCPSVVARDGEQSCTELGCVRDPLKHVDSIVTRCDVSDGVAVDSLAFQQASTKVVRLENPAQHVGLAVGRGLVRDSPFVIADLGQKRNTEPRRVRNPPKHLHAFVARCDVRDRVAANLLREHVAGPCRCSMDPTQDAGVTAGRSHVRESPAVVPNRCEEGNPKRGRVHDPLKHLESGATSGRVRDGLAVVVPMR